MTMPKGWHKEGTIYTYEQMYKIVVESITRTLYDIIESAEKHNLNEIDVAWLRNYTDNLAIIFPHIIPKDNPKRV